MRRIRMVFLVSVVLAAMVSALSVSTAGAARTGKAVQGVSDDEIVIGVLQADLDGLRNAGSPLPAKLTSARLLNSWKMHVDAMGPVNGRTVKLVPVQWDPTQVTTFDRACTELTQDVKPFMAVNNAGWRPQLIPCVTVDGELPLFVKDPVHEELFKQSGNKLWTLQPASDVMAKANVDFVAKNKLVPKTAKIGILASNDPGAAAAADALQARFKKKGYTVASRVDVNALGADVPSINREGAVAANTFSASGVDTVFSGIQTTQVPGFFQEAARTQANFDVWFIDDAPAQCMNTTSRNLPVEAVGTKCLTAIGFPVEPGGTGTKEDSEFEAECRATNDTSNSEKSFPGAPAGDVTIAGVTYVGDMEPLSCTMYRSLIYPALKAAGKNLTWNKVAKELAKITDAQTAGYSGTKVGFGKGTQWAAKQMNLVELTNATATTPKDASGLFGGCTVPIKCWVPTLVEGKEWHPILANEKG